MCDCKWVLTVEELFFVSIYFMNLLTKRPKTCSVFNHLWQYSNCMKKWRQAPSYTVIHNLPKYLVNDSFSADLIHLRWKSCTFNLFSLFGINISILLSICNCYWKFMFWELFENFTSISSNISHAYYIPIRHFSIFTLRKKVSKKILLDGLIP